MLGKILPGSRIYDSSEGKFVDPSHEYVKAPTTTLPSGASSGTIAPGETISFSLSDSGRSVIPAPGREDNLFPREGELIKFRLKALVKCGPDEEFKEWENDSVKLKEERDRRREERDRRRGK